MKPIFFSFWKSAAVLAVTVSSTLLGAEPNSAQVVKRELDASGLFYSYMDFEDGWGKVARDVNQALKDTPQKDRDWVAFADATGLSQIRALGLSSTSLKDGYDNRIFLFTPGGRKGLLAIFPGEPAAFDGARYAPADADFFAEVRLDVPAVVSAAMQIATCVSSNKDTATAAFDLLRKDPLGYGSLLNFKGRVVAAVRLHSHEEIEKSKAELSAKLPVDIFFRAEGGGSAVAKTLAKEEEWKREERGNRIYFTCTKDEVEAVVIVEGETVTAGMPRAFVEECLTRKDGLAQSTVFKQALADTAQKGHAVVYVTPRAFTELRATMSSGTIAGWPMAGLMLPSGSNEFLNQLLGSVPLPTKAITSVIVARPDGLLVRERAVQSLKATFPVATLITPDFLGQIFRVSALAYATKDSEERAGEIVHEKISADLDHAGEVASRYLAAHTDEETVKLSALREAMPTEKLPDFKETVASDIEFSRQSDKVEFELKIGSNITHVFKLTPAQRTAIEANLKKLADASIDYLVIGNSSPGPDTLVEEGFMSKLEPVVGEDYGQVTLSLDTPTLTATTPGNQEIFITRDPFAVVQARHRQAERQIAIERNIAKIDAIAQQFLVANPDESSVSFDQLAKKELVSDIKPVADEDYTQELSSISKNQDKISVSSKRTGTVTWVRPLAEAIQADFTKQLREIEKRAAKYFEKNPEAELVISGELLPPPVVKEPKKDASSEETAPSSSENEGPKLPDLTALVIRRDYKSIKVTFDNGQEIEAPRSSDKK